MTQMFTNFMRWLPVFVYARLRRLVLIYLGALKFGITKQYAS